MNAANHATPRIVVKDLNFYYGKYLALKNINLDIAEKKVTAFIGPSGCGKSTLLRTFNRMYQLYPQQTATGAIMLDGENILDKHQDLNKLRAKIGMVFQKPTPFPMSIYDNIAFGVKLYNHLSKNDMDERVELAVVEVQAAHAQLRILEFEHGGHRSVFPFSASSRTAPARRC